jgi:predicted DCC family thiol-disulfide oxidoreductase YuxK
MCGIFRFQQLIACQRTSGSPMTPTARQLIAQHPHIILFDGVCNLCNGWVNFVIDRDPDARFHFASVQSAAGQALLQHGGLPLDHYDTIVYIDHGDYSQRSTAVLNVLRQLPAPASLASMTRIIPRVLRDWGYDRIAQNRYRLLGRSETCRMPTPDIVSRFL